MLELKLILPRANLSLGWYFLWAPIISLTNNLASGQMFVKKHPEILTSEF
mgnify:CR=1 FL=1